MIGLKILIETFYLVMIENITYQDKILSIIIRANYEKDGLEFFTPDHFSQQLAYMNRPSGYEIPPHVHNEVQREVVATKEVLYIKSGKVQVDFYNDEQKYLESRLLFKGDVILLAFGGHGFKILGKVCNGLNLVGKMCNGLNLLKICGGDLTF